MGDEFFGKLMVGVGGDTSALATSFAGISPMLGELDGMLSHFGTVAVPLIFVAAGAAIAGFAIKAAKEVGGGFRIIKQRTGEIGPVLDKLGEDYRKVLGRVPEDAKSVGEAMSLIRQRTGAIGPPLEELTKKLLDLARITDSDVKPLTDSATGAFNVWNIATKNQSAALDYLYKISAATGMNINSLMETAKNTAPIAQILGWSFEKTAAFAGQLTKEGLSADKVFAGLRMGLKQVAKAGKDPQTEFPKVMSAIKDAKTEAEAITIATTMFGRAAVSVVKPIRDGKLSVDDFMASLEKGGSTIDDAAERTFTLQNMIDQLTNLWNLALEPLGKPILKGLKSAVEWAIRNMPLFESAIKGGIKVVQDWAKGLDDMTKMMANNFEKAITKMKLAGLYFSEGLTSGQAKLNIQNDIANLQIAYDEMTGKTRKKMAEFKDLWNSGLDGIATAFVSRTPGLKGKMALLQTAILSSVRVEDLADKTGLQIERMAAKIAEDTGLPVAKVRDLLRLMQAAMLSGKLHPEIGDVEGDAHPEKKQAEIQRWLDGNLLHPKVGEAGGLSPETIATTIWGRIQAGLSNNPVHPVVGSSSTNNPGDRDWPTNAAAGGHIAGEVVAGMQDYFDANMTNPLVGAGGGAGSLEGDITKLTSAWEVLNKTAIYGWSEATNVAAGRFGQMEEGIASLGDSMGPQIIAWRDMRGALDEANVALKEHELELKAAETDLANLEKQQTLYNDALEKSKAELDKLSSMKIAGETAASDASFAKQQEILKLELEREQIELRIANHQQTRADYARLSEIKIATDKLNLEKQIIDTQASIEIDPQKRELEKLLDPLSQQEMSYEDIKARIIDLTTNIIPAQQKQYDDVTGQIEAQRAKVEAIQLQHDQAAQAVAFYSDQVEQMAKNFLSRYDEMIAKAKELADAQAKGGGAVPTYHGGGIVMHSGGEVEAILKRKEFVMQEAAVAKYGVGFMNAINSGAFAGGSGGSITVGDVHLHSVSPDYDVKQFYKLLNETGRRAAHEGRVLKGKGRI